jgi:hypothetical protein
MVPGVFALYLSATDYSKTRAAEQTKSQRKCELGVSLSSNGNVF